MSTNTGQPPAGFAAQNTGAGVPEPKRVARQSHSRGFGAGFLVKLVLMALVNAFGLFGILSAWAAGSWAILTFLVLALVVADLVYFLPTRKLLPAKYLYPGLLFLLVFQVFVLLYTAGTAFTNYGDGTRGTKEQAVNSIIANSVVQTDDSTWYNMSVATQGDPVEGPFTLFLVDPATGTVYSGDEETELAQVPAADVTVENNYVTEASGYTILEAREVNDAKCDHVIARVSALKAASVRCELLMLTALFVMTMDYVLLAVAHTVTLILIGRIIGGIMAATHATAAAYMADISTPEEKGRNFGLIGAAFGVGFVLGPVIGSLASVIDLRAPFWIAGALAAVGPGKVTRAVCGALSVAAMTAMLPATISATSREAATRPKRLPRGALDARSFAFCRGLSRPSGA